MDFDIRYLEEVDSTNNYLQRLAESGTVEEGVVIVAAMQTSGRGHGDNSWESERAKNLTFSLLLKPWHIEPANQFNITMLVSLAISNVLEQHLQRHRVSIKWPNDIYAGDKKIAGMLIQNSLKGNRLEHSIVGIGLNVNQTRFLAETPNPVSIKMLMKSNTSLDELLRSLLAELLKNYEVSYSPQYLERIRAAYLGKLYRLNEWSGFRAGGAAFQAKILGIGQFGRLKLQMKDGQEKHYGFKELEMFI
jgi:BirA family biotin operon repressor/biotin-[acetyl-CoA-carboxylase] ligase